jgi:hypothetical protein
MMSDLPELSDEVRAQLDALTPESVAAPPPLAKLTPKCLWMIREWLWALEHSDLSALQMTPVPDDEMDQSITAIVADHRAIGIDLRDRHDLLTTYHALQLSLVMIQQDWARCGDVHTYMHFARPLSNIALAYELLLLEVFGEDAAFYPEGGEE